MKQRISCISTSNSKCPCTKPRNGNPKNLTVKCFTQDWITVIVRAFCREDVSKNRSVRSQIDVSFGFTDWLAQKKHLLSLIATRAIFSDFVPFYPFSLVSQVQHLQGRRNHERFHNFQQRKRCREQGAGFYSQKTEANPCWFDRSARVQTSWSRLVRSIGKDIALSVLSVKQGHAAKTEKATNLDPSSKSNYSRTTLLWQTNNHRTNNHRTNNHRTNNHRTHSLTLVCLFFCICYE